MSTTHEITATEVPTTATKDEPPRSELEMEAKHAEERLLATLEKVDRRRHHVETEIKRAPRQLLVAAVVTGAAVVGIIATAMFARRKKAPEIQSSLIARLDALHRAWTHPDRIAPPIVAQPTTLVRRVGASAMSVATSMLLSYLAKRATTALIAADHAE